LDKTAGSGIKVNSRDEIIKIAVVVALSLVVIMAIIMSGAAIGLYYFLEFRKGTNFTGRLYSRRT